MGLASNSTQPVRLHLRRFKPCNCCPYHQVHASLHRRIRESPNSKQVTMSLIDNLGLSSLYQALVDAGVEVSNHYSDLYYPATSQTTEILSRYPDLRRSTTTFINNITQTRYYDTPFQYTPYWEKLIHGYNQNQEAQAHN